MSNAEKQHIIDGFSFEVGKVQYKPVQQKIVDMFGKVDHGLAAAIAQKLDVSVPPANIQSKVTKTSPALSREHTKVSRNA